MKFLDKSGTFELENADKYTGLYFPLGNETGLKSCVSPNLSGDAKLDQNHFLLEPVSIEGLHNNKNSRNFWIIRENKTPWSLTGNSVWQQASGLESTKVTAGPMWHQISRDSEDGSLRTVVTSFIPVFRNVEIHIAEVSNLSSGDYEIQFVSAIPIFGRSADNIRDHRHVTSLLHRISTYENGVVVDPTLSFDERGHQVNDTKYYVYGMTGEGDLPIGFLPEVKSFIGEGGSFERPLSLENIEKVMEPSGCNINGEEALGGLVFEKKVLHAGETITFVTFAGIENRDEEIVIPYSSHRDVWEELKKVKEYWSEKVNVSYKTADPVFDGFMKWVSFQPELRRIFGCSFLPHHDYGKGGRGWRDLWQDCLALLIMDPSEVRRMLLSNFEGVRIDGTNATIIGTTPGEFKADRNGITRVWMDHAFWPLMTTAFYIDQTGDIDILFEKVPYYKDKQVLRGKGLDEKWDGLTLREKDLSGGLYEGTVLEHLLLQNLSQVWEVGEKGNLRLRDADWNDALDMAGKKGESVAFTHAYAGNLEILSNLLSVIGRKTPDIEIFKELNLLLSSEDFTGYSSKKNNLDKYLELTKHGISGEKIKISVDKVIKNLLDKTESIRKGLNKTQWIEMDKETGFFRGYYDNDGESLEGIKDGNYQMTLTGQVFAIMCGTASPEEISKIANASDKLLYDKDAGGYRLNTDFGEVKTNMGRMFGFAFGEKENGAVFSHMAVMYANALYKRGFAHEGYKALNTLFNQSMNFSVSHIYPGIPEYFGRGGRGLYHYLTGAASWYMMTVINQMFGVRGDLGELIIEPKLVLEQFDEENKATLELTFREKPIKVVILNPDRLDYGQYVVGSKHSDEENRVITVTLVKKDNRRN